jgi:hypothetical protein
MRDIGSTQKTMTYAVCLIIAFLTAHGKVLNCPSSSAEA